MLRVLVRVTRDVLACSNCSNWPGLPRGAITLSGVIVGDDAVIGPDAVAPATCRRTLPSPGTQPPDFALTPPRRTRTVLAERTHLLRRSRP